MAEHFHAENAPEMAPFTESDSIRASPHLLKERMQNEGYLFFRGLVAREDIEAARTEILARCAAAGWLQDDRPIEEGAALPGAAYVEPQLEYMKVYNAVQQGECFHTLAHSPPLLRVLENLFEETPLPHPRNIARIVFPQNTLYTTPAHQDYLHVQGTEETYTAWIPLGECPMRSGSLIVLKGSHRSGIFPVHTAYGAGGVGIDTDSLPFEWVGSDFHVGDVVLFHSLTVHKALPNLSEDRLRLSVDYRYQPLSHPIDASSLEPHYGQISWAEIYRHWQKPDFQYYWKELPITLAQRSQQVESIRAAAKHRA